MSSADRNRSIRFRALATGAALVLFLTSGAAIARAQEAEGPPSPDEVKKKVLEIERLMREAEDSLARSLDATSAEAKARRAAKLLDQKSRDATGKSAEELRKLAEQGAKDAAETLRKLTEEANRQAGEAAEGVRKLLEETKSGCSGASRGIEWILERAVQQSQRPGSGSGSGNQPEGGDKPKEGKEPKSEQPKDPQEKSDQPKDRAKQPPESQREKPRDPKFEKWLAELPPQVRKAYETRDWDSIPPKWRDIVREWTKKMAEDMEKERK